MRASFKNLKEEMDKADGDLREIEAQKTVFDAGKKEREAKEAKKKLADAAKAKMDNVLKNKSAREDAFAKAKTALEAANNGSDDKAKKAAKSKFEAA